LEEEYEEDPELEKEDEDNEYEGFDYDDFHLDFSGEKPPKYKWEDVIVIDDVDVPNEVAKTENNAEVKEEHVTLDVPNQHDIVDDDVLLAPIKRSKKQHIKINARLYRVFDEEKDGDEAKNKNLWEVYDEVADEDVVDDENEVDDEHEWI
nr:hypothetical protein [Tanacetum cinerariifolium]